MAAYTKNTYTLSRKSLAIVAAVGIFSFRARRICHFGLHRFLKLFLLTEIKRRSLRLAGPYSTMNRLQLNERLMAALTICGLCIVIDTGALRAQVDLLPNIFAPVGETFDLRSGNSITAFEYDITDTIVPGRTHLQISFGTANIGAGPMIFHELEPPNPDGSRNAVQRIMRSDSSWWERPAGILGFHPEHGHVHLDDWAQYRIREYLPGGSVGSILAEGPKTSFCIIDLAEYDLSLPNAPLNRVFSGCGANFQGISVGWIDIYDMSLPGQDIDITDLSNGLYWLEGEFDPENKFLETNKTNNIGRKAVVLCHQPFTIPADDSMWISEAQSPAGSPVMLTASVRNERTLGGIVVPFSWDGPLGLRFDSVSVVGTRTDGLATPTLIAINPFNSSAAYALNFQGGVVSGLLPGSGPVLNLFFTIPPGAALFETNGVLIQTVGGHAPAFGVACGAFTPSTLISGLVTNACCDLAGDADNNGLFNIADITFGIARIFADGPAPQCQDKADANGNNAYNIADITYGIARIFAGGPPPVCGTTGS